MIVEKSKLGGLTELADNRGISSMPLLQDCQTWWREWGPRIAKDVGRQGWVLFLLDANERLVEVTMSLSMRLRGEWKLGESLSMEDTATAALRWYEAHAPGVKRDAPDWAQFLIAAQYTNFCALARAGREIQHAIENGYTPVVLEERDTGITCTKGGERLLEEVG